MRRHEPRGRGSRRGRRCAAGRRPSVGGSSLLVWLVADGWFVLREKYCWLVAGGWFVLR
jgi:hypothetical protein